MTNMVKEDGLAVGRLYDQPVPSTRTGPIYNAFSYPTKIDPEAIAVFIAAHTEPGDTVLDVFGGSGTTGIATRLCDKPTDRMREIAADLGVEATWGPRNAVVYELSPIGALASSVMCDPPDPNEFEEAATDMIARAEKLFGWAYEATSSDGEPGHIRYVIWTEVLLTPCCAHRLTLWEASVRVNPVVFHSEFRCPSCKSTVSVNGCRRATIQLEDPVTGDPITQRERVPACVYGRSKSGTWSRPPTKNDLKLMNKIEASPVGWVPSERVFWGDLHRSGYHTGVERYHHFYTPRNLRAVAALWGELGRADERIQDALRLLILSYNATHSTLLTRVVAKQNQRDFIVTGAQSGVLYISGLPVEKNVFVGVRRKIQTFADAFAQTRGSRSQVRVVCGSSTSLQIPDASVDYVFTDPPFGDFIPYAEVNQINEAWLGRLTDRTEEAIVSTAQNKGAREYARLMSEVFAEVARVLRPMGRATVVFHASKPAVWKAVDDAFFANGLAVERTSILDKTQVSFKQIVSDGGTRGDALFLLRKAVAARRRRVGGETDIRDMIAKIEEAAGGEAAELSPKRMYSRYVGRCIKLGVPVAMNAPDFYRFLDDLRSKRVEVA